jgi:hypothetical protein
MADYRLQGFENETYNEFMLVATHPAAPARSSSTRTRTAVRTACR